MYEVRRIESRKASLTGMREDPLRTTVKGPGAPFLAPGEQLGIVPPCPTLARRAAFGAPSPLLFPEGQAETYDACTRLGVASSQYT